MIRALTAAFAAALAVVMWATPALAGGYLDEAAATVQRGQVFAPGNPDAAGQIQPQLDGHIAVALLPASAVSQVGSAMSFAQALDNATHHRFVVITQVGTDIGYASHVMSATALATQLANAKNQAQDPVQQVVSFVSDIEQVEPTSLTSQPTASPKTASGKTAGKGGGMSPLVFILPLILIAAGAALLVARKVRGSGSSDPETARVRMHDTPDSVQSVMEQILRYRGQINDSEVRSQLTQLAQDLNEYFRKLRLQSPDDLETQTGAEHDNLGALLQVLAMYVEVQDHPRYYDTDTELRHGRQAISGYSEYILANARRVGQSRLLSYNVNTRILNATRYRNG